VARAKFSEAVAVVKPANTPVEIEHIAEMIPDASPLRQALEIRGPPGDPEVGLASKS